MTDGLNVPGFHFCITLENFVVVGADWKILQ